MPSYLVNHPATIPTLTTVTSVDTLIIDQDALGISVSQDIIDFITTGPLTSSQKTVIIHQAHRLTPEAQNALLKTLEEPPPYANLYLVTPQPFALLPTVLSRCLNLSYPQQPPPLNPEPTALLTTLDQLNHTSAGLRLSRLPPAPKRPDLLNQLTAALIGYRQRLLTQPTLDHARQARLLLSTFLAVKLNANLNLSLAHLYLHW